MGQHPQMINTYEGFIEGNRSIGLVTVENVNVQSITAEVKGSGRSGTSDVPVLGQTQDMTIKLTFDTPTEHTKEILTQKYHHIEFWIAIQTVDSATGNFVTKQEKIKIGRAHV